jgi:hypothetical protein
MFPAVRRDSGPSGYLPTIYGSPDTNARSCENRSRTFLCDVAAVKAIDMAFGSQMHHEIRLEAVENRAIDDFDVPFERRLARHEAGVGANIVKQGC